MNKLMVLCFSVLVISCGKEPSSATPNGQDKSSDAHAVIATAIEAHGGLAKLKEASTWVAEIRRFQRGDSYVMTNYYRPGMVRLEQDLGDGKKSADVIGDPHCWGMHGPVSIPCSAETRENDRPRVIMEIGAQIWPLKDENWQLLETSQIQLKENQFDVVKARYLPRDTLAEFTFDSNTHLLRGISVQGVKGGVFGTHTHEYSDYQSFCGVQMPAHNVKSFEGEVWVAENVLDLRCEEVNEDLFVRPQQVADGTYLEGHSEPLTLACLLMTDKDFSDSGELAKLQQSISEAQLEISGPILHLIDGSPTQLCTPINSSPDTGIADLEIKEVPATGLLSIFSLSALDTDAPKHLLEEAGQREMEQNGTLRRFQYDNDGMGATGELVIEWQLPVVREE